MTFDPEHPLDGLRRSDKYQLGGGEGLLFAPAHPRWLERPGFWDGIQLFQHVIRPAFTIAIVRGDGRELRLDQTARSWTPAELDSTYIAEDLAVTERRVVLGAGRLEAVYTLHSGQASTTDVRVVAWTALEGGRLRQRRACVLTDDGIAFRYDAPDAQRRGDGIEIDGELRFGDSPSLRWIAESQWAPLHDAPPDWSVTPFAGRFARDHGRDARAIAPQVPVAGRTLVFLAVALHVRIPAGGTRSLAARLDVWPAADALRPDVPRAGRASDRTTTGPARAAGAGVGTSTEPTDAAAESRRAWCAYFADAPSIEAEDPFIGRGFAYRWYGLRLNFLGPAGHYRDPCCAEGPGFFHSAISYSAWCLARELRWLPDAERARGTLRAFFRRQRDDGAFPGILYLNGAHPTASYFADWGGSVLAIDEVHPDRGFLEEAYGPLSRYAAFLDGSRDPDRLGLYRVRDPYETGQETMSRYMAVDASADTHHFDYRLELLGVDLTVYAYRLHRALAHIGVALGRTPESRAHDRVADRIGDAVRSHLWDAGAGLFSDVDPRTMRRTGVKAAVSFYPYMTDIVGPDHVAGLERNLFDPATFWTPFPVPSTAADDPTFDADGFWKGVRQNCPWNGRVWPMANSHVAEALGALGTTIAPWLRERAADFLRRFLRMMFFDGDPARPNSFEHYSPVDGEPCTYRGLDDYMHSWTNDLTIRYAAGLRPAGHGFLVDPLPCGLGRLRLAAVPFRGHTVAVSIDGDAVTVVVDGRRFEGIPGEPLRVAL